MNKKSLELLRKSIYILIVATVFLVPLIVTLNIVPVPDSLQRLYNKQNHSDLFAFAKAQVLQIGVVISIILTGIYQLQINKKGDWKQNRVIIILFSLFAISILLSFILSDQKQLAWVGMIDRYEGTLTWLCYIGLAYITIMMIKTKKELNGLVYTFVISASFVSIIGAFQMIGYDFFKTDLGMLFMLGSRFEELFMSVNFNLPEGRVYTTLYNPNYVGSLVALAFPLTLYSIVVVKKWWIKPFFALLLVPQMLSLIGSKSTGGLVAVVMTVVFIAIFLLIKFPLHKIVYVGAVTIVIITYLLLTRLTLFIPYYDKIMASLDADPESYVTTEFASVEYNHPEIRYILQNGEYIDVAPIEGGLDVASEGEGEVIQDQTNKRLIYKITSDEYIKQVIYHYNENMVRVWVQNLQTEKTSESRFNYYYSNQFSVGTLPLDKDNYNADSIGWFENERFMSGRGYIWNRTIPMVLERPLFGYGADTYTANYPQGDLIYKQLIFYNHAIVVDKPHNLFLNIALNFGFVGLILFLGISAYAMIRSRLDFLVIPILSYFVVGLVNDSVVFGTYMIFVLFGLLLALPKIKAEESI